MERCKNYYRYRTNGNIIYISDSVFTLSDKVENINYNNKVLSYNNHIMCCDSCGKTRMNVELCGFSIHATCCSCGNKMNKK
jgi:hypothetical protein